MTPPIYPNYSATRPLHATSHRMSTTIPSASKVDYPVTHEEIVDPVDTRNFIDNEFVESKATTWIELHDPATNNLVTRVPVSTEEELKAAVDSAAKAFPGWKKTSLLTRQQIMFKFVSLIRENWDRLAASITLEQGKTFADAKGDVLRGLQVAEVWYIQWHVS
jgi:malonate-semialdehyde dehydrogenase (acetylating)/methylmalonate-semialdehyde dehydrogenase